MKIVVASDSFKGTLTSREIAQMSKEILLRHIPDAEVFGVAIADGGEGTADAFVSMGAELRKATVTGPLFKKINASYAMFGDTAIIEMAQAAGLPLVRNRKDPKITTTYGVGELILNALDSGCRRVILGLGGSATNDCGAGMAAALGIKFYDVSGQLFIPVGGTLSEIEHIDLASMDSRIPKTEFIAMCDVSNPLYGTKGAAYIFAPQKGADEGTVKELDAGLKHVASLMKDFDIQSIPGSGAAGGMGAGCIWFLNAKLKSGIDTILDAVCFDDMLEGADFVITGEGRLDSQSFGCKVLSGIKRRADTCNVPIIVISGCISDEENLSDGLAAVYTTSQELTDYDEIKAKAKDNYINTLVELSEEIQKGKYKKSG